MIRGFSYPVSVGTGLSTAAGPAIINQSVRSEFSAATPADDGKSFKGELQTHDSLQEVRLLHFVGNSPVPSTVASSCSDSMISFQALHDDSLHSQVSKDSSIITRES
jgi:hypothetical protein